MRVLYFIITLWMLMSLTDPILAKTKHKKKSSRYSTTKTHVVKQRVTRVAAKPRMVIPTLPVEGKSQLATEINKVINDSHVNAAITVYVKSMQNGDPLFARNIYQPLIPASILKVLTAEAALLYLTPDYRFSTQLLTDAKEVKNGVLQGNLYIILSGDPSLTYYDLADLLVSLRSRQIQAIDGNVYIDNTAYDQRFYGPGWEWKDKKYCYGAPISASIINHNCLSFQVAPSKVAGHAAQVVTSPKYFYPNIKNTVMTTTKRSRSCSVRLSSNPGSEIVLDGCMSVGRYAWGVSYVVEDIPEYNRALFKSLLKQLSVRVYGNVTFGSAPDNLSYVGTHNSKPLRLLITDMLKKSDNVIAGALFKKLGQVYSQRPGSWENGSVAVSQILSKRAGVNTSGMKILDGSGLSTANQTTSLQLMQALDFAYHHSTHDDFISALPIAGVDGTLKYRLSNVARRVHAKTGTIAGSGVVSLAGYVTNKESEPLAFVIMINGSRGLSWRYRALEDKIVTVLAKYRR